MRSFLVFLGLLIIGLGAVLFPLPVPLGLPLFALGLGLTLGNSRRAKRSLLLALRRFPETLRPVRRLISRRRRRRYRSAV